MQKFLLASIILLTARCATIANGRFQQVPVNSDPAGANVRVACGDAATDGGITPTKVTLRRNAGSCSITLSKPGFRDDVIAFRRVTSGWFWGNMASPGLVAELGVELATGPKIFFPSQTSEDHQVNGVGFLAGTLLGMGIDHATGAQYKMVPDRVEVKLRQ